MKKYDFGFTLQDFDHIPPFTEGYKSKHTIVLQGHVSLCLLCKEQESIQPDKVKLQLLDRELINRF